MKKIKLKTQKTVLITGSAGFIAGYLVEELLKNNYRVIGIDNFSKYGPIKKSYDNHPNYKLIKGDVKNVSLVKKLISHCDQVVACAAKIGGIGYFHKYAYDLLAENERILASTFDAAIWAYRNRKLKRIIVISSSMVFENTKKFPTPEGEQFKSPPPYSTYGFQKLASEYFAKGAWEQYRLPYTIIRPFNCIGIGEKSPLGIDKVVSGNIKMAMSHVVPDLCYKILRGQYPVHILGDGRQIRCYTYGGDIARGIRLAMESKKAINEDFNISSSRPLSVLELAKIIWKKINPNKSFKYVCDPPFPYDVKKRIPDISKAKKILGFEANTSLEEVLDEIISWIKNQIEKKSF